MDHQHVHRHQTFGSGEGQLMNEPLTNLAAQTADRLLRLAARVSHRYPIAAYNSTLNLDQLADPEELRKVDLKLKETASGKNRAIYQFTANDPATYDALRTAFKSRPRNASANGNTLKYSRMMNPARPGALYVGSGRDLRTRIGQHLGRIGGPGTFSMRLALWAIQVPAAITLEWWIYEQNMDPLDLELLEQELWDARTPLLGKRSGR
jgi:hypothetical protein